MLHFILEQFPELKEAYDISFALLVQILPLVLSQILDRSHPATRVRDFSMLKPLFILPLIDCVRCESVAVYRSSWDGLL